MDAIETEEYNGYNIKIFIDEDAYSPREDDNLCQLHCWHKRMNIGDKDCNYVLDYDRDQQRYDEVMKDAKRNKDIILPLYIYQHGGVTISLTPFSCPWDSGQVGYVIIPRKKSLDEFSRKRMSKKFREKVVGIAKAEIETYDQYLRGDVYGYKIEDAEGEETDDSCWGFYGTECCMEEAKSVVDYYEKQNSQETKKVVL
jgi:hypothetical protein